MKNKREMIRVIKTSENEIILDATGKKNGRGAYLCADSECLKKSREVQRTGALIKDCDSQRNL